MSNDKGGASLPLESARQDAILRLQAENERLRKLVACRCKCFEPCGNCERCEEAEALLEQQAEARIKRLEADNERLRVVLEKIKRCASSWMEALGENTGGLGGS